MKTLRMKTLVTFVTVLLMMPTGASWAGVLDSPYADSLAMAEIEPIDATPLYSEPSPETSVAAPELPALDELMAMNAETDWDGTVPAIPANTNVATVNAAGITGNGTEDSPFLIKTAKDFVYFWTAAYNGKITSSTQSQYWKLDADIDLANQSWATYIDKNGTFKGKFDGNHHTISNMKLAPSVANKNYGLFCQLEGLAADNRAEVKNLTIDNATIEPTVDLGGNTGVGFVVGKTNKYADIINVKVTNSTITYAKNINGNQYVGGVVGQTNMDTKVQDCSVTTLGITAKGTTTNAYFGGLIGHINNQTAVTNCSTSGVSVTYDLIANASRISGLIGSSQSTTADTQTTIKGCSVSGTNINLKAGINNGSNIGALLGQGGKSTVLGDGTEANQNTVTSPIINVGGDINAASYIGGAIGDFVGATGFASEVKKLTVTSPSITVNNYSAGTSLTGGVFGRINTFVTVDGVNLTGTTLTTTNIPVAQQIGTFAGQINGSNAQEVTLDNVTIYKSELTFGSTTTSNTVSVRAGVIGQVGANVSFKDWTVSGISNITVNGNLATSGSRLGGFVGSVEPGDATGNKVSFKTIKINGATTIEITGNIAAGSHIGGFVGYGIGRSKDNTSITMDDVTLKTPTIKVSGAIKGGSYVGGFAGYLATACKLKNCEITTSSTITIGEINTATSYVGGAIANIQGATGYPTTIDGLTVPSPSVTINTIAWQDCYVGGVFGRINTFCDVIKTITASNPTVKCKSTGNLNKALNIGSFAGGIFGHASQKLAMTGITVTGNSALTIGEVTKKETTTVSSVKAGFIGQSNTNVNLDNWTIANSEITINGSLTSGGCQIGGFSGYLAPQDAIDAKYTTNNITLTSSTINVTGGITVGSYLGGFAGYIQGRSKDGSLNTTSKITLKTSSITVGGKVTASSYFGGFAGNVNTGCALDDCKITTSATLTLNGGISAQSYIGGAFGNFVGVADFTSSATGINITKPKITLGGDATATTLYVGGLAGYQNLATLKNSTVSTGDIILNISNTSNKYIGGAVGYMKAAATDYSTLEKVQVLNGKIKTGSNLTFAKGSKALAVGGLVGYMEQSATTFTDVHNCVVDSSYINLSGYKPESANTSGNLYNHQQHTFVVGGVIGRINTPSRLPKDLYYSGKIYAPFAAVGPIVGIFHTNQAAAAYAYDDYTGSNAAALTEAEWEKAKTWFYTGYKLGLTDNVRTQTYRTRNFKASTTPENDVNYLTITPSVLIDNNKVAGAVKPSKTILAYTASGGTDQDKTLFPAWNTNSTTYPEYYMYYMQGINRGIYVPDANAEAVKTIVLNGSTATMSLSPSATRGFVKNFTVTPSEPLDSYEWYVNGVKNSDTSASSSIALSIQDVTGSIKDITVIGKKGGNAVAIATGNVGSIVLRVKDGSKDISTFGTSVNPYLLGGDHGADELQLLSHLSTLDSNVEWEGSYTSVDHYNKAYYEMDGDIDLKDVANFTPISFPKSNDKNGVIAGYHQNFIFSGVFDGKGHKICGLKENWYAGALNSNNYNMGWGLFSAVGSPVNAGATIKNLVIDGAVLTHKTDNTSFYYNNGTSGNGNFCHVGVLAGIVGSNTTIQNIQISNSQITDAGTTSDYNLATKGLYVGGAVGSVQYDFQSTANAPVAVDIQHIAAKVDISLTRPQFAYEATSAAISASDVNQFNVGGIVGRYIATSATQEQMQSIMPKYTLFSGTVNARKAWISPVVAALRYASQQGNDWKNYSKQWEGNNAAAGSQITITNAQYYDFKIYDGAENKAITDAFPSNTCGSGFRTMTAHGDASEVANTYGAPKYQGVNYGAKYIASGISLELLNKERTEGYSFVWDSTFVRLTTDSYVELSLVRKKDLNGDDTNEFKAVMEGGSPTTYNWQVSFDGTNWKDISGVTGNTYNVPVSLKTKYVKASTNVGGTDYFTLIEIVEADKELCAPKITAAKDGDNTTFTFNLNQKNVTPKAALTTTYQWYSTKTAPIASQTSQTLTLNKTTLEGYDNIVWCEAVVKELGVEVGRFFIIYGATVVYVNGNNYDKHGAKAGNDETNTGRTPDSPVKTIDKANQLLKSETAGGTIDNNIIVVMGELNPNVGGKYAPFQSRGHNPATITGYYDNTDYEGLINIDQWNPNNSTDLTNLTAGGGEHVLNPVNDNKRGANCYILGDTKFEKLTFKGNQSSGNAFIECHGRDAIFGKGLVMTNFKKLSSSHGNMGNSEEIPEFTILLMATNLGATDINNYINRIHDRGKPQTVTFQSGHYGRLMCGRFTQEFFKNTDNSAKSILGSAAKPIWAVVNVDIDNENPQTDGNGKTYTSDINAIIAGLTDGSMYGDYEINVHGGLISYIVGANQGNPVKNGTKVYTPAGDGTTNSDWGQWPNASYFGRTVINVEQNPALNRPVNIGNLYAGGLGRELQANNTSQQSVVDMYLYGRTEVNINSGTVTGSLYGGGAGGVLGLNPWDAHVPYATDAEDNETNANNGIYQGVQYGTWGGVKTTLASVEIHNKNADGTYEEKTQPLDLANTSTTLNISGTARINGSVFGGGYGFVDNMPTEVTMQGVGSVFGTTNVNVSGGTIGGSIYGGSQGHTKYFGKTNHYGQVIDHIAEMNGTVNMRLSGTPSIGGDIYGAGQGIASATVKATQADVNAGKAQNVGDNFVEEYPRIATTGNAKLGSQYKSTVNVTIDFPDGYEFNGNIFGGGKLGAVDGNINVVINGGSINGNVYGGGKGEKGHLNKAKVNGTTNVTLGN